jgi:hypothetical protein
MIFCTGCHRSFKPSGYTLHVQRSCISACASAYNEALQAAELNDDLGNTEDISHFQGDFFGNYEESDLQWPAEPDLEPDDSDDNDDVLDDDQYIDIDMDTHQEETHDQLAAAEDHQGPDSTFVEHFPNSNMGASISDNQGSVRTDFDQYKNQCSNINGYAPFASQIEWDIAHWTKVHGITSTAVSDLLGINGVGFSTTYV